ncbi:MAG: MFS transporter [Proteobacteria bacterium]|nr:MFS transporter [Pseudomonadota bacterium]
MTKAPSSKNRATPGQRFSWCLYDFANSAFPTVIITAVYVLYFKNVVMGGSEPGRSDNLWGMSNSLAAIVVFLIAPVLGAAADMAGHKRLFLTVFTLICVIATGLLFFTGPGTVVLAMGLVMLAIIGFEGACVFYNAFLPELVSTEKMGRLSGKGWALGYLGGLGCLLAVKPLTGAHITLIPPLVGLWFLAFAIPALLSLKDKPTDKQISFTAAIGLGLARLKNTFREIRKHHALVRFLTSYFFYNNAVLTIIVFAVAFSSDSLGFTIGESVLLVIVMNMVASPGALAFGYLADRIGPKAVLVTTLVIWLIVVAGSEAAVWPGLFSPQDAKSLFWAVAALASLAIGAIQATSRSFVGQMAPDGRSGEFYGFMAFAGKGSAILGPLVFGLVSDAFDSQRAAVATIGLFFLIGLILLLKVPALSDSTR